MRLLGEVEGYLTLGLRVEAAESLAAVSTAEADLTPVWRARLAVCMAGAEWDGATEAATLLCGREPEVAGHWIDRAYATRRHVDIQAARRVLAEAVAMHPMEATIHFNLACYDAQIGRLDEARRFLATACELAAEFAEMARTDPDLEPLRRLKN